MDYEEDEKLYNENELLNKINKLIIGPYNKNT